MEKIDVIELTRRLIHIDSSDPGAYEGEIGDYIEALLNGEGIDVIRDEVMPGRSNLMARLEGKQSGPAMIFICHMDTVTHGEGWHHDALGAETEDGKIYGRGACDMKSGLACTLTVFLEEAQRKERNRTLVFIGTVDEEDYMRGVERAIEKQWVRAEDWILDTEPTNGQIQPSHKGRLWFELEVEGVTAHASTPWKGADAVAGIAEMITCIRREISKCPEDIHMGRTTVTFGMIDGGYRPYVVPDKARVTIDMRLVPPTDRTEAERIVQSAVKQGEALVEGVKGSYHITGDRPYVEKDETALLLKYLQEACIEVNGEKAPVRVFPGYTDTAVIAGRLHNINCMSFGPGKLELAHKPDEYVHVAEILNCKKVLSKLTEIVEKIG